MQQALSSLYGSLCKRVVCEGGRRAAQGNILVTTRHKYTCHVQGVVNGRTERVRGRGEGEGKGEFHTDYGLRYGMVEQCGKVVERSMYVHEVVSNIYGIWCDV